MARLTPIYPTVILLFVFSKPNYRKQKTLSNLINKLINKALLPYK